MTECVDQAGNEVDGVKLSVDGTSVTIDSKYTAYCTLYFGKCGLGGNTVLKGKNGLSTCPVGGMFRYQGAIVNNFICFGTNSKDSCLNNREKYMYHIIGVTPDNHLKIMKDTDIGIIYWTTSANDILQYNHSYFYGSNIYNQINGEAFLKNDTYVPATWESKIYSYNFNYGYSNNFKIITGDDIYRIETGQEEATGIVGVPGGGPGEGLVGFWKSNSFKVGLPYVHDYLYSIANNTSNCSSSSSCSSSWMKYTKDYLTMSLCGSQGPAVPCGAWYISSSGNINHNDTTPQQYADIFNIRPTFYLNSNITLSNATGLSTDPYIITN